MAFTTGFCSIKKIIKRIRKTNPSQSKIYGILANSPYRYFIIILVERSTLKIIIYFVIIKSTNENTIRIIGP